MVELRRFEKAKDEADGGKGISAYLVFALRRLEWIACEIDSACDVATGSLQLCL